MLQVTGIASHRWTGGRIERVTALGFHPNNLARILITGLLALIGLTYGRARAFLRPAYLVWGIFALMGVALVQTGSRGGLIALCAGLAAFVTRGGGVLTKLRNALGILLVVAFLLWVASQSEIMRARFERTLEEGDLARREQIYPSAWGMFQERPLAVGAESAPTNAARASATPSRPQEPSQPHLYGSSRRAGRRRPAFRHRARRLAAWRVAAVQGCCRGARITVLAANMSCVWLSTAALLVWPTRSPSAGGEEKIDYDYPSLTPCL